MSDVTVRSEDQILLQHALCALKFQLHSAERELLGLPSRASLERAALALRKCLEGVALSTLIVNGPLLDRAEKAMAKLSAKDFLKLVTRANPGFWPKPQDISMANGVIEVSGAVTGELRREDYGRAIGVTSAWLHWRNPLAQPLDIDQGRDDLGSIFVSLERLLRCFTLTLPGSDSLLLCSINFGRPGQRTVQEPAAVVLLDHEGTVAS
nr:hypothetical protein [Microbacterium testaceum]